MSIIPRKDCDHPTLAFGSGDYYVFCMSCNAMWATVKHPRAEYGIDKYGNEIGCATEESNQVIGMTLSGHQRIKP